MLRARQKFGKYVIERRLAEGGFACVYAARDTIEGIRVALKIPFAHLVNAETIACFKQEARVVARLSHPSILPLKYADYIDGQFVIVTAMGECSLEDRLQRRLSVDMGLDFASQMLSAVAYAHEHKVIHCDIKPDNFLLFPDNKIRLADFGIARVATKTIKGSGTGTVGYIAPEQAMGQPSFRSDVFSLGLIFHRMFSGQRPEWPYEWPSPGFDRLANRLHPKLIELIRKAIQVNAKERFRDAGQMRKQFLRIKPKRLAGGERNGSASASRLRITPTDWKSIRHREFQRVYGKALRTKHTCTQCRGPVSEAMQCCPWCGKERAKHTDSIELPLQCPRCSRGMKSDWHYCGWCFGPGFEVSTSREYPDRHYASIKVAKCENPTCERKLLMPFMKYCPWCRRKVRKKWKIPSHKETCSGCGWGVAKAFWSYCPWCCKRQRS